MGFLQAIPAKERGCLETTFGAGGLAQLLAKEDLSPEEEAKVAGCISEDTARRIMLGMALNSGVSEKSVACVSDKTKSVSYLKFMQMGEQEGPSLEIMPIMRAMVTCLSNEEWAKSDMGGDGQDEGPNREQLACLFTNASDEDLAKLFNMGGGSQPTPDMIELATRLATKCDLPMGGPGPGGEGGPPQLTAEQQQCIVAAIGAPALQELMSGRRPPTQDEAVKIQACGVPVGPDQGGSGPGGSGGDGGPGPTPEQLQCIIAAIGEPALRELTSGQRPPTQDEAVKIQACGVPMGPGGGGTPPPATPTKLPPATPLPTPTQQPAA